MAETGHIHPATQMIREMNRIFNDIGFEVITGDEAVTSYYNFDSLNIPKNHPARESQDTFWLRDKIGSDRELLRTHTSSVQVEYMEKHTPPYRVIVPGRVFRNETTDTTHEVQFHQVEGFYVDKGVTLAHLKGVLQNFFDKFLKEKTKLRFRPGYFPFTEPSLEVDIEMSVGDKRKWIEVLGAGMIHPAVLKNANIDANVYQGFAFGMGVERMSMLRHKIQDTRDFYRGDLRFINQF